MAETVVLFCILYCGNFVTKCVSDSLAQTTLKSQRLSGANSYKKIVLNIMTVLHTVIILQIVTEYQSLML